MANQPFQSFSKENVGEITTATLVNLEFGWVKYWQMTFVLSKFSTSRICTIRYSDYDITGIHLSPNHLVLLLHTLFAFPFTCTSQGYLDSTINMTSTSITTLQLHVPIIINTYSLSCALDMHRIPYSNGQENCKCLMSQTKTNP